MVTEANYTYHSEHFVMYVIGSSLGSTPETDRILFMNYPSITNTSKREILAKTYKENTMKRHDTEGRWQCEGAGRNQSYASIGQEMSAASKSRNRQGRIFS